LGLASNNSGARNGIEQCSAAKSCWSRAVRRSGIGMRAGSAEPKSIRIGVVPSSEIIMFAWGSSCLVSLVSFAFREREGDEGWNREEDFEISCNCRNEVEKKRRIAKKRREKRITYRFDIPMSPSVQSTTSSSSIILRSR